ncbi:uncharacterized protein LOC112591534 [Rhizophagus irregularis DAOM 181602=DAOM 197198]|nr:uncharacterized protein LOC112591534 [Rhizophagus irregularis DAOM 181602=DAOM 197198]
MDEVCDIVPSNKGNNKINVRGYLMVKERNRETIFYWCCAKRKSEGCKGRAVTTLCNNLHYLRSCTDHNHAPQASDAGVAKLTAQIKRQASETRDKPAKIIQDNIISIPEEIHPYIPSPNALRRTISRVRKSEMPPQPQNITEINIPESLCHTLHGNIFLVKDYMVGQERILLFTTRENIQHLANALFWIMDGTFKTVPTIFHQMYTIHAPVGAEDNSRILPLVYALMTRKSEVLYRWLFENLIEFAEDNDIELKPQSIITDFELAAINVSRSKFPDTNNKGCFFHLCQNGWRQIQRCGLAIQYGNDEHFSIMVRHLFALAFLPSQEIPAAFNILKPQMPQEANDLVQWFEDNYVLGRIRREMRNGHVVRSALPFPPQLWSVYDSIQLGIPRTQNVVEAWHRRWEVLVGESHVGLFTIINEIQREQQQVELQIECIIRGEQRKKQKKVWIERENRIMSIINERSNRSLMEFLRGIAHNLSF